MPTNNVAIAQNALDSFTGSHGHQLQSKGTEQDRMLAGILAALISIATSLETMAGEEPL